MSEHEILKQAYFVLGLEQGSSSPAVTGRYKKLILVWHPDRFKSAETKDYAQAELKRINGARDILNAHFQSGHKDSGPCQCRADVTEAERQKPKEDQPRQKDQAQSQTKRSESEVDKEGAASNAKNGHANKEKPEDRPKPDLSRPGDTQLRQMDLRQKLAILLPAAWLAISLLGMVFGHG